MIAAARSRFVLRASFTACCCAIFFWSNSSYAYTPRNPEVREMIDAGLAYLAKSSNETRLGGKCVVGLAFVKEGQYDHPRVQEAIEACQEAAKFSNEQLINETRMYSLGLALIFLCELDAEAHRSEIDKFLGALAVAQKPHGGWGYPADHKLHALTGDTSMTQYAVLGLWTADQKGIPIRNDLAQRVCVWLGKTQDPSGAWGYQGNPAPGSGADFDRIEQKEIRPSMAVAGLGSIYMCADLLGLSDAVRSAKIDDKAIELPPALVPVDSQLKKRKSTGSAEMARMIKRATTDGNKWFNENYTVVQRRYGLYYLYSMERFKSFRELVDNIQDEEPRWYNDGVAHLKSIQQNDGSWTGGCGKAADTAFATLFLMRSTKISINQKASYGSGLLTGGRGLPQNLATARIRNGRIVGDQVKGSTDDLLAILENPEHEKFEALIDNPGAITLGHHQKITAAGESRFRRLVRTGDPAARLVAVKALGRRRNLDNVSTLIYALTDPDPRVAVAARDALRFVSRKFKGFNMPDDPTKEAREAAEAAWRKWYASVRPDATFLN